MLIDLEQNGRHDAVRHHIFFLGVALCWLLLSNLSLWGAESLIPVDLKLTSDPQFILKERAERFLQPARKGETKIIKEPHYQSTTPQYFQLPLENGKGTVYIAVVADEAATQGPLLYIDTNNNGDLTDDGVFRWEPGDDGRLQMDVTIPSVFAKEGALLLRFKLTRVVWPRGAKWTPVYVVLPEYSRVGHLQVGSKRYLLVIHNHGGFADTNQLTLGIDLDQDGKIEDSALSDEEFEGSEPFNVAGESYVISHMSERGDQVLIKVSPDKVQPRRRLRIGSMAPEIALPMFEGKSTRLSDYRGKVLLLEFWTTYCSPCIAMLPELKALYGRWNRAAFEIIGISLDETRKSKSPEDLVRSFVSEHQIPWPVAIGGKGMESDIVQTYNLAGVRRDKPAWSCR
jgi:thiol-disulfide isomerase/thioredoxin